MSHHSNSPKRSRKINTFFVTLFAIIFGFFGIGSLVVFPPLGVFLIAIACLLLVSDYSIIHNAVVKDQEKVDQAWSDIEVLLQQQQDTLTQIKETVEQATEHEREVLNEVVEAREAIQEANSPTEKAEADQKVRDALTNFSARVEAYPELRSLESIQQLQDEIESVESKIAQQRKQYNNAVTEYNTTIRSFPGILLYWLREYDTRERFETSGTVESTTGVEHSESDLNGSEKDESLGDLEKGDMCSNCGEQYSGLAEENYCPNCGTEL